MHFDTSVLELYKIKKSISDLSSLNITKERILAYTPSNNFDNISAMLNEVETMRKTIVSYGDFPFGGMTDIESSVILSQKKSTLNERSLTEIKWFISGCQNINNYIKKIKDINMDILNNYLNFNDLRFLKDDIGKCINDNYDFFDNASISLNNIRKNIRLEETKLRSKLHELIQKYNTMISENIIVLRNDRLCLCIKSEHKNSIKGIIHDESKSKTTAYIEPSVTYDINNKISTLKNAEKKEIEKILSLLSDKVNNNSIELLDNLSKIISLDGISSKAKYAIITNSILPSLNKEGITSFTNARHPLINKKDLVPLNIVIGVDYNTIIITGPNTGGKTVALKTVGLLTLMMQSGILVPSEKADMSVYDNVFADIGDEQSIEQSLSTFSSHMSKIINIVNKITKNSLVLLDELGGGTDPKEGTSLAISLLNYFQKNEARIIITTHYSELKAYAYETKNAINASMEFNSKTYKPTYRLLVGISGKSNAFEISKQLGLKNEIINDADMYLMKNNSSDNILMKKIEDRGYDLEEKIKEYELLIAKNNKDNLALLKKRKYLEDNEEQIIKKAKSKAAEYIDRKTNEANNIIRELETLKNENVKDHKIASLKFDVKTMKNEEHQLDNNHDFKVNDLVTIISYDCQGQIMKTKKNKFVVKFGNLEADFEKSELLPLDDFSKQPEKKIIKEAFVFPKTIISNVLDMRGMRYEEGITALDKFIDDALIGNLESVTIVHGFGTGVLRKGVQDYLKKNKVIKNYRYGGQGEGLNGATIAYLK